MLDLIIEQRRIPQLLETKIICPSEEYWTIDLEANGMVYDPGSLKKFIINEHLEYLDTIYVVVGIEFYSIVKEKIVLIVKRS